MYEHPCIAQERIIPDGIIPGSGSGWKWTGLLCQRGSQYRDIDPCTGIFLPFCAGCNRCWSGPEEIAHGRQDDRHPLEEPINEFQLYAGDISNTLGKYHNPRGKEFVDALLDSAPNIFNELDMGALQPGLLYVQMATKINNSEMINLTVEYRLKYSLD